MSPARHTAISSALNAFSLALSRYVLEDIFKGKLLYSGGDDVLAMVSVDDLLSSMLLLRLVYSGIAIHGKEEKEELKLLRPWLGLSNSSGLLARRGHVYTGKRLYRVMGAMATASLGAVVAHHTTPLGSVLTELRQAEKRAKNGKGKDAFSISLLKRAGGRAQLTLPWSLDRQGGVDLRKTPMGVLISIRNALADEEMSRRAAYAIQEWILELPGCEKMGSPEAFQEMLSKNLAYQLGRQCKKPDKYTFLGSELAEMVMEVKGRSGKGYEKELIHSFLTVAEFLAREGRLNSRREEG